MQVVLDMREKELEERQMEMAKILTALNAQREKLQSILSAQENNKNNLEILNTSDNLDIPQIQSHRDYGVRLSAEARNQERIILNTEAILKRKQQEVLEAHQKVEVLRKLKEKQEKEYYKEFLQAEVKEAHQKVEILKKLKEKQEKEYYKEFQQAEMKEIDDMTSARYRFN